MDKVAELGISFRLASTDLSSKPKNEHHIFELWVEANVIGTDGVVLNRRHKWVLGYVHKMKSGVFISFNENDPPRKRMRVYTDYQSKKAIEIINRVDSRIASTVAPKHSMEIKYLDSAVEMFEEIHSQLTVYSVIET